MENTVLSVSLRTGTGKGISRKLRGKGIIPAVCYGRYNPPVSISVDPHALAKILNTPLKRNTAITLQIENEGGTAGANPKLVMVKDLQYDPLSHAMLHADFLEIKESEHLLVNVPIVTKGRPKGVAEGGILQQVTRSVQIKSLPRMIPPAIEVDVSDLNIGQSVHINEVKFPEGVEAKFETNFTVAVVVLPVEEVAEKPATAEGVEGVEAPAEAAAAPAGDATKDAKVTPAVAGKETKSSSAEKKDKS